MSVESTLNEIRDLLAEAQRSRNAGKTTETVDVNVSAADVEEANEKITALRKEIALLIEDQEELTEGTAEYQEVADELVRVQTKLNEEYERTQNELLKTRQNQLDLNKALEAGKKAFVGLSSRINDVQSLSRELERTGAASRDLSRDAIKLGDQLRLSLGEDAYEDMTQATKALVSGVTDFTMVSKEQQKSLMRDAALFNEVGVSNEQYTKNIQIGMKALGMSSAEAADNMRDMRKTALALQVPVTQLMDDFAATEEKLSQLGDTGVTSFKEMARIQKITGFEMGKLIQMTDKFDTFEGAAEAAGSLNAALGGNFVDSMSLMMEDDPAERFKIIRDAIESSGQSLDTMSRKQKMFMAGQLDLSVADFTKAMSGDLSALEDTSESAADAAGNQIKSLEDSATLIRSQTELAANFALSLEPAYGILADKAMNVTDDVSDKFYDMAQYANKAQIAIAEMTPDILAAGLGAVEGTVNTSDKILGIFSSVEGALMLLLAAPGKLFTAFGKVTEYFGKGGKFRTMMKGAFESGKKGVIGFRDAFKNGFTKVVDFGKKAIGKTRNLMGSLAKGAGNVGRAIASGPGKIAGVLTRLGPLGRGVSRLLGAKVTAIASIGNMIFESGKGVKKALATAGSDATDAFLAGLGGLGKGAAEAIDFLTGGLLDKLSSMTNSLGIGFNEAWEALDFSFLGETLEYGFDQAIESVKGFLGISSPSKVMMDIGMNMLTSLTDPIKGGVGVMIETATSLIEAFLTPWTTIGTLLMEIIQPALDMVPDSIKNLFMGDAAQVAGELQTATVDPNALAPGAGAMQTADPTVAATDGQAQVINISLNLDGKEIDKKVINLLGGIVKEAVL